MPNIPDDGVKLRRVAVTVAGRGIPSGEIMDADIVATAGNDGVGSEEGVETSAAAAEADESCGGNYPQSGPKRQRIGPPVPQQQEEYHDTMIFGRKIHLVPNAAMKLYENECLVAEDTRVPVVEEEQEEDCREAEIFGSKICLIADAAIELYEKECMYIS